MLLNTAAIRMVYAIVSPCELGPIDGRIKKFKKDFGQSFSSWDLPTGEKHIYYLSALSRVQIMHKLSKKILP